jgi:hypothetical protein
VLLAILASPFCVLPPSLQANFRREALNAEDRFSQIFSIHYLCVRKGATNKKISNGVLHHGTQTLPKRSLHFKYHTVSSYTRKFNFS